MNYVDPTPRRFKIPEDVTRPYGRGGARFGVYFPGMDLCVNDMGGRSTGVPQNVDWIDEPATLTDFGRAYPPPMDTDEAWRRIIGRHGEESGAYRPLRRG